MEKALNVHEGIDILPLEPPDLRSIATSPIQFDSPEPRRKFPRHAFPTPTRMIIDDDDFHSGIGYDNNRFIDLSPDPMNNSFDVNDDHPFHDDYQAGNNDDSHHPTPDEGTNDDVDIDDPFNPVLQCRYCKTDDTKRPHTRCNVCLSFLHYDCMGEDVFEEKLICGRCMHAYREFDEDKIEAFSEIISAGVFAMAREAKHAIDEKQIDYATLQSFCSLTPALEVAFSMLNSVDAQVTIDEDEDDNVDVDMLQEADINEDENDEVERPPRERAAPVNDDDLAGMIHRGDMTEEQYARAIELLRYKSTLPQDEEIAIGE